MLNIFIHLLVASTLFADTIEDSLSSGIQKYQAGQFAEALQVYELALQQQPNNASLLYNRGLSEYRLGQVGPALASWRRALYIDPSLSEAQSALDFAWSKLERKELPHEVMLSESLHFALFRGITINHALMLLLLGVFSFGWSVTAWLNKRRLAMESDNPPPSFGGKGVLFGVVLVLSLLLTLGEIWDSNTSRGTILPKSVEARVAPDSSQPTVFEIYEGLEVIIQDQKDGWFKIHYPGGRSGWVPENAVARTW